MSAIRSVNIGNRQRGAVLFFAIVVLAVTTLAGVALTRSVDTANMIAGNLAFQQSTAHSADVGVEAAVNWLEVNNIMGAAIANPLYANQLASGYSALWRDPAPGQSWAQFWDGLPGLQIPPENLAIAPQALAEDGAGNTVAYIIQRLCNAAGAPTDGGVECAVPLSSTAAGKSKGGGSASALKIGSRSLYRVTVRIDGPRNTVNFVQTIIIL